MHWYHWVLVGMFVDVVVNYIVGWVKRPYRWHCPVCQFKLSTNNKETLTLAAKGHTHELIKED